MQLNVTRYAQINKLFWVHEFHSGAEDESNSSDSKQFASLPVSAMDKQQTAEVIKLCHWEICCESGLHAFLQTQRTSLCVGRYMTELGLTGNVLTSTSVTHNNGDFNLPAARTKWYSCS